MVIRTFQEFYFRVPEILIVFDNGSSLVFYRDLLRLVFPGYCDSEVVDPDPLVSLRLLVNHRALPDGTTHPYISPRRGLGDGPFLLLNSGTPLFTLHLPN